MKIFCSLRHTHLLKESALNLFVRSFIYIHPFILFVSSFLYSLFTHAFIQSLFRHWSIHSYFIHSFIHSLIYLFIHLFICLFTQFINELFIQSINQSLAHIIYSVVLVYSAIHSFRLVMQSVNHSFFHKSISRFDHLILFTQAIGQFHLLSRYN